MRKKIISCLLIAAAAIVFLGGLQVSAAADTKKHFHIHWDINSKYTANLDVISYKDELKLYYESAEKELLKKNPKMTTKELYEKKLYLGYVRFVEAYLDKACQAYEDKFWTIPSKVLDVYIVPGAQDAVYKPVDLTNGGAASLTIHMVYESIGEARHDIAHELFHWLQNVDYTMFEMNAMRWLTDMTADYAPKAVVLPQDKYVGEKIRQSFLKNSLTYDPGIADRHKYHAARLLDFINAKKTLDFRLFYMDLVTGNRRNALINLEDTVIKHTGNLLFHHYRAFAANLLFSPQSPVFFEGESGPDPMTNGLAQATNFKVDKNSIKTQLTVGPEYCAEIWGVTIDFDNTKSKTKLLKLDAGAIMNQRTAVDIYKTKDSYQNAKRVGEITEGFDHTYVRVEKGDKLYIVAANAESQGRTFGLTLSDTDMKLTVDPKVIEKGEVNKTYTIFSKLEGDLSRIYAVKYAYDFGDGTKKEGSAMASGTMALFNLPHAYAKEGTYQGSVKVYKPDALNALLAEETFVVKVVPPPLAATITASADKVPPKAQLTLKAGLNRTLSGISYLWELGDGRKVKDVKGQIVTSYQKAGKYNVVLKVLDAKTSKELAKAAKTITVEVPPKAPTAAPPPAAKKEEYKWVMTEVIEFNKLPDGEAAYTISGGNGSYSMSWKSNGCYVWGCPGEAFGIQFSWTPPPPSIAPGDKVQMDISAAVTDNTMQHYSANGSISVYFDNIDIDPGFVARPVGLVDDKGEGTVGVGWNMQKSGASVSKKVSATLGSSFPQSGKIALIVSLYNGRIAGTKYIYEWKKVGGN